MTLAGIELRYLVNNITDLTKEYYLSNIYGISKNSLLLKLHHPEKPDIMLMLSTFGIWISKVRIDQIETNRLLKRLRSDLTRLKISHIKQINAERIVYITFDGFGKEFVLIGEFFSDGNIILCNKDMKILALAHSIDVRHRQLKVGLQYTAPPQNGLDIFDLEKNNLVEIQKSDMTCGKWIGRTLGLPSKYVEEIFRRSQIDPQLQGNQMTQDDIELLYKNIKEIVNDIVNGNHESVIIHKEKSDVYPIKMGDLTNAKSMPSFMDALDELFTSDIIEKGKSNTFDKEITELQNRIDEQEKAIVTVIEKSDKISTIAKIILDLVSQGIMSLEDEIAIKTLEKLDTRLIKEKGIIKLKINDEKIAINLNSSLHAIASILFTESKKQFNATSAIKKIKKDTEKKLKKLSDKVTQEQDQIKFTNVRRKKWFERYRWFYTSDGLLAIGGRDAASNSSIIRKHMEKDDIIFHADLFGSPFFILKQGNNAPLSSINEVAHATVCFSRGWREAMYGVSAYWVTPDQVKRSAPSGEFLPKGSFTIEGQRNFIKTASLRLAVGLVKDDDDYILTCSPVVPMKNKSTCYAIIEPGGSTMVDAAKRIRKEFLKINETIVKPINLDDFVRILPAGDSDIKEYKNQNEL